MARLLFNTQARQDASPEDAFVFRQSRGGTYCKFRGKPDSAMWLRYLEQKTALFAADCFAGKNRLYTWLGLLYSDFIHFYFF